jgi:hypothetical protein
MVTTTPRWRMNHYASTSGNVTRHIVTITTADHTRTICELENVYRHAAQGDNHDARLTETLAHGKLIAAAPALLVALCGLVDCVAIGREDDDDAYLDALAAAINTLAMTGE